MGLVWTVYEMACFLTLLPSLRLSGVAVCRGAEENPHGTETVQKTAKFPQLQFYAGPRQFLDKVVFMPVACRQCWGPDVQKTVVCRSCSFEQSGHARCCDDRCIWSQRAENFGGSAVAVLGRCLLAQFIDGCGRPGDHGETVVQWQCLWIQFIARVRGQSSCATENGAVVVMAAMTIWRFGLAVEGLFRRY